MKQEIDYMNKINFLILLLVAMVSTSTAEDRPNILWFVIDDMSANFSCYGAVSYTHLTLPTSDLV